MFSLNKEQWLLQNIFSIIVFFFIVTFFPLQECGKLFQQGQSLIFFSDNEIFKKCVMS